MQCYTNIEVMKVLATKLTISQYKEFCGTTCFAQLSSIRRCHVQAQLIRCMFLREIEGSSKDAILIHVNDTTLRFTIHDFAIISGLKCSDNEKDFVFNTEEPNRIILQYFGIEKAITKSQLVEKFDNKVWGDNDDDAVKFAILFYIHSFILLEEPTSTVIDRKDFDLVESGRYIDYPWGKKAFDLLILHLHTKIKHDGKYFRLYGFPLALQVWFYECCSNFDEEIAVKVSHHIPRILNWKTKKDFPRLSYFAKGMFRDDNNPLVFKNITPTPMELKILELPPEYVQSDSSPTETAAANASDDDFQDPPYPINNKGKEKVDSCLSPPKKKSRQTITPIQKKTTPRVISKQPCLIKSPRRANVAKRPKSPLPKRQAEKHANVPSYTGIKQNVEIKSSVPFEIPSTSKSHDFSISRDEFDQFKLSMEKQFTDLRNFIENNFKVVLDSIKSKNAEDKGDSVEVTDKVSVGVVQSEEPSQHLPSELNCQSVFNDLNDQEKVVRVSVPSSTPDVSITKAGKRTGPDQPEPVLPEPVLPEFSKGSVQSLSYRIGTGLDRTGTGSYRIILYQDTIEHIFLTDRDTIHGLLVLQTSNQSRVENNKCRREKSSEEKYQAEKEVYLKIVGMEKCKHEAIRLLDDKQKQKTVMELLEQYIQFQQGSIVNENKKKKKEKDPLKPKQPLSAFFMFTNVRRAALLSENNNNVKEATKITGKEWKIMIEQQNAPYEEMTMMKKRKYLQEMKVYKKKKKDEEAADHMKEGEQSMKLKNQEALQLLKKKEKRKFDQENERKSPKEETKRRQCGS
ncbi:hypothetical protein MTR67_013237 [Solanum verrucosum]|uniref:HMG box domain-containing protein n=1 Tax=Solanum verrucosum TaxID=315347 RepID=A0AAF0TGQ1_SOLVR|nr:hypothetical protein MTR67_013237 [Solanum verrucosum]